MPPKPLPPKVDDSGLIKDPQSGLYLPSGYRGRVELSDIITRLNTGGIGNPAGLNQGYALDRDPETYAVRWPAKGSGLDEFVSSSIVDGTVANVGVSPVPAPQISAMVLRYQRQAETATIDLTGRKSPVSLARDAIAMFNDSPIGAGDALKQLVYNVCTYNRGSPIATVPITYEFDQWASNGLTIRPLLKDGEKEEDAKQFYLEVNWERHGTPVPYLPSIYDLEPTGIVEWPYWYRIEREKGNYVWVLLHKTHILPLLPGLSSMPGIGTSPVWLCLGFLAENMLVIEERAEKLLYSLTDGITIIGGVEGTTGDKILTAIKAARTQAYNQGFVVSKGQTILSSPHADKVAIAQVSFRQQPANMDPEKWRQYGEDIIAFCFGETLSAMVIRGGVGYGVQSDTGSENSADSGVGSVLASVASVFGAIYTRVSVSVSRPNDRALRLNMKTLTDFSTAATPLIDRQVFSPAEVRAIIDRDIILIPEVDDDTMTTTANSEDSDDDETVQDGADDAQTDDQAEDDTTDSSAPPAKKPPPKKGVKASRPFERAFADSALYDDDDVTITGDDVDRALELAQARIDDDLYGLLTATAVEE